ncbi:hypothetical protein NUW58_g6992 [Xylaria curta]|uniref:Uncharacterized protein n=1 Tax=Xylaria curta TaxID=42375 RepID=A0ACC1NLW0_9PEZI|nr:hypothetical protein NUW58_g6992 [Xylaria curta]
MRGMDINLEAFWDYYLRTSTLSQHDTRYRVITKTHRDVIEVVKLLKAGATRLDIKQRLRDKLKCKNNDEEDVLENSIDLAASLLVMCDCGVSYGCSRNTTIHWEHNSLKEFLTKLFAAKPILAAERTKFEKSFKAVNLSRIAALEVVWTDNLVDHLRLTDDDTKVHIFHHASFLETQRWSSQSLLPANLVAETIQTLALLFPSADRETRKWASKLPFVDLRVYQCGRLKADLRQIENFQIWRDRLVILKQIYDEAQPKTLRQWWHDRRNGMQWYMFWFAVLVLILTVFFGLVQGVEGALQVYASLEALSGHPNAGR